MAQQYLGVIAKRQKKLRAKKRGNFGEPWSSMFWEDSTYKAVSCKAIPYQVELGTATK